MRYCKICTYPESAVNITIDEKGYSSTFKTFKAWQNIKKTEWEKRRKIFEKIVKNIKSSNKSNYDCVIAVSGGKDSYFQTHVIKSYGLKPLLVTYHGNNYLPEGDYNRDRMKKVFDADHIVLGPSQNTLIKLNKIGFEKMGDMNWHNHTGLLTTPIQIAAQYKIPYVIYGEPFWDISGMFKPEDFVEFSARVRLEFGMRGYDWSDIIKNNHLGLTSKDMVWAKYPSDNDLMKIGLKGLFIGNYFKWDPKKHTKLMIDKYKWKPSNKKFERTYRTISNVDDRYENGIHDYMKFVKFGYGRATDHSSKDILTNYMTRKEGIKKVKKHDHILSKDLYHWLDYVNMKEIDFHKTADKFRSNKVWWIKNKKWYKDDIWGGSSSYGNVYLSKADSKKFER
jgi:N-acetyl sugar amidotransferase